ncbi:hypothetical protein PFICI_06118 [Pestalotiopsis fici W106-1]|uniref:DJ-1/PfpI domain-containing protein n=1 Tax=Pestalotiopsis fici (strain W106-1 / CGMCC3.15140) TaxID=1229662 RepID=W3X7G8_PESFW|nr:uncharacterized protein PFICI_06118 [Pestalotiopsis fici W106-1]ETS81116.1 hypothetical protein PFICI_06118 [Pestalotiopsis fici W106-1]
MSNTTAPLRIAVLLFPALTALDVFGPLNALNLLSIQHPMTLSLLSTDLKPVSIDRTIIDGVYQGTSTWLSQYFSEFVLPTNTFDDDLDLDVIMVPGGAGTRNLNATQPHVDWLKARVDDPDLDYMMTVCTVDGAEDVNWIAKARWVVDGNLWTSSGVSAGTDMTLAWIEHVYGRNESERIRIMMEWNALNQTDDPFAELYGLV